MIQVTDQRYLDQIDEQFRGNFRAEVKLFFKSGAVTFEDDDIFSISEDETANIVADENPSQSTEITLSNYNHQFDINATSGYFRDIADGIECQYRFGFNVLDEDGTEETVWLDWKRRWCDGEATLSENQVTFNVTDLFSSNEDEVEYYMSANYGLIVDTVFNKSSYPKTESGTNAVEYDQDLVGMPTYYEPTYSKFNEIIQAIAFASGKQLYIDHKGVVHIDDERTTLSDVHLTTSDYYEDEEVGKTKKVKKITVSYYVSDDSNVEARPDLIREIGGLGETVDIDNDFICSIEDGNRLMSSLVNYYEKRGTFNCKFRGDPRLEPLDVISIDILNSDGTTQTVQGTIISIQNEYDGNFESTIECRYLTTDQTDAVASITGADNFVYPLESGTPSPTSLTLSCTTSITSPTTFEWEYYNIVTGTWTAIQTGQALTVPYNTSWLNDDTPTTFRCTVDDTVSASVTIKRVYQTANYRYLGILDTPPANPSIGDYYLAETGYVYLWNGSKWVSTTKSDLLMSAVADGKTLTGIGDTPLGQLIASMSGEASSPYLMSLSAESMVFQANNAGVVTAGQYGVKSQVSIVHGTTSEDLTTWTLSVVSTEGITAGVSTSGAVSITAFSDSAEFGTVTITAVKNGITLTKQISCSKAKQGNAGENGSDGTDGEAGQDGTSPYILVLSQDNFIFTADSAGNVSSNQFGVVASATVYHGDAVEDITTWTLSGVFTPANNFTGSINADGQITISSFASTSDIGYATITATKGDITLTKVLRCTKSKQGQQGQPGQPGEPGASAQTLLLQADSYNFHTDSEGNVKPNQTIVLTVQKQNILDDITWADNKGINVPKNTLSYEFKSEISNGGDTPVNLAHDLPHYADYPSEPTEFITGNASNILVGDKIENSTVTVTDNVVDGGSTIVGNVPDGSYYVYQRSCQFALLASKISTGHNYYIRADFSKEGMYPLALNMFNAVVYIALANSTSKPTRYSCIYDNFFMTDQEQGYATGLVPYMILIPDNTTPIADITARDLVVVDITANQAFFTVKGLTTDEEIRQYLDGIEYDQFSTTIGDAQPNPALDGTPTIFTVTADGLTSSVQIGYVEDGETGEDGKSITTITTFYLATSQGSGVTVATSGWTETVQTITETNRYLWIYQDIYYSDGTYDRVEPYISGVYGNKGEQGEPGAPGEPGEATMLRLVASAETFEISSRNVVQTPVTITVEARVSGTDDTTGLTWTITPTLADGYTTGKGTTTITTTIPQYSTLTGYHVHAELTGIGSDDVYITGVKTGEPTPRFFEIRTTAPTTADNQNEPFITGDFYCTTAGVPMMYDETTNSWRAPTVSDKYYDTIMTTVGNYWVSHGNDINTTVSALYGYFSNIYSASAVIDNLVSKTFTLKNGGIIQSTVTLPDGTVRGYEVGDGETYGVTGFVIKSDGTAEFYNMYAYGITARGSFDSDVMTTGDTIPGITVNNILPQYQSQWTSQTSVETISNIGSAIYFEGTYYDLSRERIYGMRYRNNDFHYYDVYSIDQSTFEATYLDISSQIIYMEDGMPPHFAMLPTNDGYHMAYVVEFDESSGWGLRTYIISNNPDGSISTGYYTRNNLYNVRNYEPYYLSDGLWLYNGDSIIDVQNFGYSGQNGQIGHARVGNTSDDYNFDWGGVSNMWNKSNTGLSEWLTRDRAVCVDWENEIVWCAALEFYSSRAFISYFTSSNRRSAVRFIPENYGITDYGETLASKYSYVNLTSDHGVTCIDYGGMAWIVVTTANAGTTITCTSIEAPSNQYFGFSSSDGSVIYGYVSGSGSLARGSYKGTIQQWQSGTMTYLGSSRLTNGYGHVVDDTTIDRYAYDSITRYRHGQRVDSIVQFFSTIIPKLNPSNTTIPASEPLASVRLGSGTFTIGGSSYTLSQIGCTTSRLTLVDSQGEAHVYSSGEYYPDEDVVKITSLSISAQEGSLNTKTLLPKDASLYNIGGTDNRYNYGYFNNLIADIIGSSATGQLPTRIYTKELGSEDTPVETIYADTMDLGAKSIGTNGYAHLPNGLLLQWGRMPPANTGRQDPTPAYFPISFSTPPYFAFAVEEKADQLSDGSFFGWIYTGTYSSSITTATGITNSYCCFSRWNAFYYRWIAIGRA